MNRCLTLLAYALTGATTIPAFAAETKPCADDRRIECIDYKPNEVVHIYAAPGQTMRIQLGEGEKIGGLFVSDQRTIGNEPGEQSPGQQVADGGSSAKIAHCDPNLCRSVVDNFVYIMPRRELTAQPFFLQMELCDGAGKCEPVPYAFELSTSVPTPPSAPKQVASAGETVADGTATGASVRPYYGVRFLYPAREAAERKREQAAKAAAWRAAHPPVARARLPPVPQPSANYRYAYRGSAELKPDEVWDDGRSTFIRFSGLRRIPNVYAYLPDGTETNGFGYASEPDATGTTLRIGKTAAKWCLRDGESRAGCIFNAGPDPEGRTVPTITGATPLRSANR